MSLRRNRCLKNILMGAGQDGVKPPVFEFTSSIFIILQGFSKAGESKKHLLVNQAVFP